MTVLLERRGLNRIVRRATKKTKVAGAKFALPAR
jgi:hypothetical protein